MARPSPAVRRVAGILQYLAQRPGEDLTLSEIARDVGVSSATAHALLNEMATEGLLLRHPETKRFTLGPVLIWLGRAAAMREDDAVTYARTQMQTLSAHFDRQVVASRVIGDSIVILEKIGPGPWGLSVHVGQQVPLVPPLGAVFMAWAAPGEVDEWLGRTDIESPQVIAECHAALQAVRDHGYALSLDVPGLGRGQYPAVSPMLEGTYFLNDVADDETYSLRQIAAPVFDAKGRVTLALSMTYLGESMSGSGVRETARVVARAAADVTESIHGRPPHA